ncbi:H+/Cl- antiporter ClcA [Pedobacter sp. CAN_A7]|uniref:voltage-gated chloride channel family protein n=1 Tax=Pedobacter sp. CAN_A7 TaxID=2787722 RepID=UPI001A1E6454
MKKTVLLIIPLAIAIGSVVALFLVLLHLAIRWRFDHPWLLYLLPIAGLAIHYLYQGVGRSSERGNNLILEEIYRPAAGVPGYMAPIILLATVITHLFGGSAGREGTAVQIGVSIAAKFGQRFNLNRQQKRTLLTCGMAAGFGAVFGTPFTGAIFAIEVLTLGRINYKDLVTCLLASLIADFTVTTWGVQHTPYHIDQAVKAIYLWQGFLPANTLIVLQIFAVAIVFGAASLLFATLTRRLKSLFTKLIKVKWLIPVLGGLLLILFAWINGKPDYLSLGVEAEYPGAITITSAFQAGGADTWSWLWKTVYTSTTLATGFKGGEVTPLFYIGATLGNTLATLINAPISLFAALGFLAVFAGATKTPLACTVMGMEIFGPAYTIFFAIACFTAYFFSGHTGIYSSQRRSRHSLKGVSNQPMDKFLRYIHIKLDKYRFKFSGHKKSK